MQELSPESVIYFNNRNMNPVPRVKAEVTCNNIRTVFHRVSRVKFGVVSFMIISFLKYKV